MEEAAFGFDLDDGVTEVRVFPPSPDGRLRFQVSAYNELVTSIALSRLEVRALAMVLSVVQRGMSRGPTAEDQLSILTPDGGRIEGRLEEENDLGLGPMATVRVTHPSGIQVAVYVDDWNLSTLGEWADEVSARLRNTGGDGKDDGK